MSVTWKAIRRERWSYIFLSFPLALFVIFRIIPMLWSFVLSIQRYYPGTGAFFVGGENFVNTFKDDIFWKSMWNTLVYTIGVVPLGLAISLFLASLIYSCNPRSQVAFKSALYLPGVASGAIMSLVWLWLFRPAGGFLNYLLSLFHLGPLQWIADPKLALPSLIFMALVGGPGSSVILLTATMGSIPNSLYESARIDGSNAWSEFWGITLPLLRPTILYLLVMGTIGSFQVFTQIYMMTQGGPYYATTTIVYLIYSTAFQLWDFGKASAEAVVLFFVILIISLVQMKYLSTDVEY